MPHTTSATHAQRLLFTSMIGLMWAGCGDDFVPDQPPPDPCAMISCNTPAEPSCQGQIAVTYSASGTCQGGACAYQETLTNCAANGQVCSNGVCLDMSDPCATISCNTPPERSCQGQIAVAYSASGTCQGGACAYQETLTNCAATGQICSSGLCVDMSDPCAGISCNEPPAPSCDGQVAVTHNAAGTCQAGMCSYQETRTDCAANNQICSNGACMAVNDPCANVSCNTPPAPSCDGQVAVTHNAAGACQAGMCSYQETRTSCTANRQLCNMGACITSSSALDLGAGAGHTCARIQNNTVRCWGDNTFGQLGDGTTTDRANPVSVSGLTNVLSLAGGLEHTCARLQNTSVRCWGSNISGQLGEGTLTFATRLTPVQVSGLTNVVEIAVGGYHSCARLRNNTVMCWGDNNHGQLGDGTTTDRPAPVQVSGLTNAVGIAAGIDHTCARRLDNTVVCWGLNSEGQLGNGANTRQTTPVQVSGLTQVIGITAGDYHSCARRQDNTVRCWGDNLNGQLGDGTTTDRNMPVQVSNLNDVLYIAAGGGHTCVYTINDTFCWGKNVYGQLGDGTTTDRLTPTLISGLNDASEFALGAEHTCALRTNGTVDCWGWNGNGRLGDGTTTDRTTPTPVIGL